VTEAPSRDDLARDLRTASFTTVHLRKSYHPRDVHSFLGRLADAVERGERCADTVTGSVFRTMTLRYGYEEQEVDLYLDHVLEVLRQLEGPPPPPGPAAPLWARIWRRMQGA
jgi:hypothetical protein